MAYRKKIPLCLLHLPTDNMSTVLLQSKQSQGSQVQGGAGKDLTSQMAVVSEDVWSFLIYLN